MNLKDTKLPINDKIGIMITGLCIEAMMLLFFNAQVLNPTILEASKEVGVFSIILIILSCQFFIGYFSYTIGEQIGAMATLIGLEMEY